MERRDVMAGLAAMLALGVAPGSGATRGKRRGKRRVRTEGIAVASFDPFTLNVATRSAPAVTVGDEDVCIVQGGDGAVTLPDPAAAPGRVVFVAADSRNAFVTVENLASVPCAVVSDGTRWVVIGSHS
jgi:hypothetical protein